MNKSAQTSTLASDKAFYRHAPSCSYTSIENGQKTDSGKIPLCPNCLTQGLSGCGAIGEAAMSELSRILSRHTIEPRTTLTSEGDTAERISIVLDGVASASKYLNDGRRQIIGFLYARDLIGVPHEDTYFSTVEAITELQICSFPRRDFEAVMHNHRSFDTAMMHVISNELLEAQEHMAVLGRLSIRERLATFICRTWHRQRQINADLDTIALPMSRYHIADYLGMSMENVSRGLRQFEREGLIALSTPHALKVLNGQAMLSNGNGET